MVLDARCQAGDQIALVDAIAKKSSDPALPVQPGPKSALKALRAPEGPEEASAVTIIRTGPVRPQCHRQPAALPILMRNDCERRPVGGMGPAR